ncbi:two-component system response regulator [Desulfobotulus mexicanus]|uniref:EAL domain-containing protein n=1 Tax=Desulfobotulus mexicanus TaxID=2586642 RepID=A0A5S5MDT9_9BACT|nr:EAL domain-containing protein [Desulfobotulus mexicanus]TYT73898.1 EAL domain-containing protein [Desulfobotulus mexicanus]
MTSEPMEQARLLIVDDTPANIDILGNLLMDSYAIQVATSGNQALELIHSAPFKPDLILLDVMMPGMDGFTVCRELKKNEDTRHIPVIFVTAKTDESDEAEGLSIGAVDYIRKPIAPAITRRRVDNHVALKRYQDHIISRHKTRCETMALALHEENRNRIRQESYFRQLFAHAPQAIFLVNNEGEVMEANPGVERILGYAAESLTGKPISCLETEKPEEHKEFLSRISTGETVHCEIRTRHANGHPVPVAMVGYPVHTSPENRDIFLVLEDISRRKRLEEDLRHQASHDALTNLANRRLFARHLDSLLQNQEQKNRSAILFVDLDRFKAVNDTLGHSAGDRLLCEVARRFRENIRPWDLVARMGGDEFALLVTSVSTLQDVEEISRRILDTAASAFDVDGKTVHIGASVGMVYPLNSYETSESVMRDADLAMYRAKACGKGRFEIFHKDFHHKAVDAMEMEAALREALSQKAFPVWFQPIVDLETGKTAGFEALVRWQQADGSMVSPADFIPLAEETGLIVPLGQQVLEKALNTAAAWPCMENQPYLAVNVSARQFEEIGFADMVAESLKESGFEAARLHIEITESLLFSQSETATNSLNRLRDMGIGIAIDDFGTGYANLACLRKFTLNQIKIDRSFVAGLPDRPECMEIVRSVMELSSRMGFSVVAEGIETQKQLDVLKGFGCPLGQGYLFSKPQAGDNFFSNPAKSSDCLCTTVLQAEPTQYSG